MCGKYRWYINEYGEPKYGWVEPCQLWLPFDHLDFTWGNLKRSEVVTWRANR